MPFEEISHTADWSLRVWAEDLAGLLTESARGMYALANAEQAQGPRVRRELSLEALGKMSIRLGGDPLSGPKPRALHVLCYLVDRGLLGNAGTRKVAGSNQAGTPTRGIIPIPNPSSDLWIAGLVQGFESNPYLVSSFY